MVNNVKENKFQTIKTTFDLLSLNSNTLMVHKGNQTRVGALLSVGRSAASSPERTWPGQDDTPQYQTTASLIRPYSLINGSMDPFILSLSKVFMSIYNTKCYSKKDVMLSCYLFI